MCIMVFIIFAAPFLVIWNTLISRNYLGYLNGGFGITYEREVKWASLSLMQFTLVILTVLITMITTFITFYKLRNMKKRMKASERSLCIAAGLISMLFLFEAVTESLFAFFKDAPWLIDIMVYIMWSTWDFLIVGSPLVLLFVSSQFRYHVLGMKIGKTQRVSSIQNPPPSHHTSHHHLTVSSSQIIP
ncbi:hypothetical protein L5515_003432 [Caenorhabditis briggsae]|uniref:Serpentine receptor class gamma n=1 Tax=Caenorhabditis briggsae TaxID=6238 RepID=A0AAE9EKK4_CAEBR|nr:hypothetical protein L5515_003432 [Caenorhabditis briggsae]